MKWFLAIAFVIVAGALSLHAQTPRQSAAAAVQFTSNGCSGFRETTFFTCCFGHDFAYWAGGGREDRSEADHVLRRCIQSISHDYIRSSIAFFMMRLGLGSGVFVYDGWGRAWKGTNRGRFKALSADERRIVDETRKNICQTLKFDPFAGKYAIDARFIRESEHHHIRTREAQELCGAYLPR